MSEVERYLSENLNWDKCFFWVIIVVLMLLSFWATVKFEIIDAMLGNMTGNDYQNGAFLPFVTAFAGFLFAILIVIWQDSIEYYFTNFSFWPTGYGFVTWLIWAILIILALFILFFAWESFSCGNIIQGLLRFIIQLILSLITFASVFVITIALIVIAIILIFGSVLLGAMFRRVIVVKKY